MTLKEIFEKYDNEEDYIVELLDEKVSPEIIEDVYNSIKSNFITLEEATDLINKMTPFGMKWAFEATKEYLVSKGIEEDKIIEYWLICNMYYNDINEVAVKYDLDKFDFYFDMAKSFIEDKDAKPFKIKKYFE